LEKHLHIVSYAIPYPPDYGGIIDVYYRIKSLHALGIKIHLHCYEYMGMKDKALDELCYKIHYYPRKLGVRYQLSLLPYIINTRRNKDLLKNLIDVDAPILFDGLHTTYWLTAPELAKRTKVVRAHNIEHLYYKILGSIETNILKKVFFYIEAYRLKRYEKVLKHADKVASVSLSEQGYFQKVYSNAIFIPSSHHYFDVESLEGLGKYVIFHGNLMVNENEQVAEWIIKNIAPHIPYSIYIAGKNPSERLKELSQNKANVKLIASPDNEEMHQLISEAQIHLLPVFNSSGLRLKLLYALHSGRHCIVNSFMVEGTSLAPICEIADTANEMVSAISRLFQVPFTKENAENRKQFLFENYNNIENAKKMVRILFNE